MREPVDEDTARRLTALDQALAAGLADHAAGRVKPVEVVAERLKRKYLRMAAERGEA
ncbi:hypothetical protein ABAC460_15335 [Asticcacaulis sp. AC460]|uniref:hypothetical protein n=1 Tax=Asticcacaulis sp. AC460 TaxID=1282360 RepID=UPI0003C3B1E1|nr:hypothetical protein [Asticcacaulis sp. AC460]ESQ88570.1 hypothetical protein ABAC460_15335 [Asticcacaulis sp. AC460]